MGTVSRRSSPSGSPSAFSRPRGTGVALRHSALLLLLLAAAAAGCGGSEPVPPPSLPAALAADLAARSDAVAQRLEAGDGCGARAEADALQADAIAAVNAGRVPARYQEELVSSVAVLVASVECVPPPVADEDDDEGKDRGKGKGKDGHGEEDD